MLGPYGLVYSKRGRKYRCTTARLWKAARAYSAEHGYNDPLKGGHIVAPC